MSDNDVCEHQNANYLRMMSERDEARRALANLRAGIEAAVVTMNREAYRQPTPWVDRLANRLCALLDESGEQPDGEGVTVEWGVGYGDQRIATESREEAEEWMADEDAWAIGEKRWLIMRQVGPWTRAARITREEADDDR